MTGENLLNFSTTIWSAGGAGGCGQTRMSPWSNGCLLSSVVEEICRATARQLPRHFCRAKVRRSEIYRVIWYISTPLSETHK
jgi:hypothetical protein